MNLSIVDTTPSPKTQVTSPSQPEICRKVGDVTVSIFKSQLFKTGLALAFSALIVTATILTQVIPLKISILLAIGVVTLLFIHVIRNWKALAFEGSLTWTILTGDKDWWTPIAQNIVLGAIPLAHQLDRLKRENIRAVLTMQEDFERKPGLFYLLSSEVLAENGIENEAISTEDFKAVPVEKIRKGVAYVHEKNEAGEKVYIHCKAGRGRSASIAIAYALKHGFDGQRFKNFKEAYNHVKSKRPQIRLNHHQQAAIEEFHRQYC